MKNQTVINELGKALKKSKGRIQVIHKEYGVITITCKDLIQNFEEINQGAINDSVQKNPDKFFQIDLEKSRYEQTFRFGQYKNESVMLVEAKQPKYINFLKEKMIGFAEYFEKISNLPTKV